MLDLGLDLDIDLAPAKFFFSKIKYHDNLIFDKNWFVYNFMDLYVMVKFSLFTSRCGIVRDNGDSVYYK